MALIGDEKIGLEYEIINDVISIRRVYVKDAKVNKVEDKPLPLTRYEYFSEVTGVYLIYSNFKKDEFNLKISGSGMPTLGIQRLAVWVSEEYVDRVDILEYSTGLRVYLDDFLEEGEYFTKEFFDAFSKEILCTIVDIQEDGLVKFSADMAEQFREETPDRFKQLITYIDKALI